MSDFIEDYLSKSRKRDEDIKFVRKTVRKNSIIFLSMSIVGPLITGLLIFYVVNYGELEQNELNVVIWVLIAAGLIQIFSGIYLFFRFNKLYKMEDVDLENAEYSKNLIKFKDKANIK